MLQRETPTGWLALMKDEVRGSGGSGSRPPAMYSVMWDGYKKKLRKPFPYRGPRSNRRHG